MQSKLIQSKKIIIIVVAAIVLISGIILLVVNLTKKDEDGLETQEAQSTGISWEVDIPEGYNVKEKERFDCIYFRIFYSDYNGKYYITALEGEEYDFEDVKAYIMDQFQHFEDLKSVNSRNLEFIDARGLEEEPVGV